MHAGNFGLFEDELCQSVVDAVNSGNITNKCLYCHEILATSKIDMKKRWWNYHWKYNSKHDIQVKFTYNRIDTQYDYSAIELPILKINENAKIVWYDDNIHTSEKSNYSGVNWHCLYSDEDNVADFTALRNGCGHSFTDLAIDNVCYQNCSGRQKEYIQTILRLPDWEIREVQYPSNPNFRIEDIDCKEMAISLKRFYVDQAVILELARIVAMDSCTERDLNLLRDKINGKIIRRMLTTCPYCHKDMTGERVKFNVNIPVKFHTINGIIRIDKQEICQNVVETVQNGNVTGECLRCHHLLTENDINPVKDGWQFSWRYDPHN